MTPDQDDYLAEDGEPRSRARSLLAAGWLRALLVLGALAVVIVVAVPYLLQWFEAGAPERPAMTGTPVSRPAPTPLPPVETAPAPAAPSPAAPVPASATAPAPAANEPPAAKGASAAKDVPAAKELPAAKEMPAAKAAAAPEIAAGVATGAVALVAGGLLLLRGRHRR